MISTFPSTPEEIEKFFQECRQRLDAPPKRVTDVTLMDYQGQYLRSSRWRRIRKRVLERDARVCQSCGGQGNVVHHRSYAREVLEGNDDSMLTTVCSGCHELIHFDDKGLKRTDAECDRLLLAGQLQKEIPEIKIDLRATSPPIPVSWSRMTAVQRNLWLQTYTQRRREKWLKLHKNDPPQKSGDFSTSEFWPDGLSGPPTRDA